MLANLTSDYLAAEQAYQRAQTHQEKIAALEHMLATLPKHKGTEKIQADLRRRLSQARKESQKKGAVRHTQWCTVATREVVNVKSVIENLEFADYDSLADPCRDYAWLITHGTPCCVAWARYQDDRDPHTLIAAVAGIYAIDPNYARLATTIAGQANVAQAIAEALQEAPTDVTA